MRNNRLWTRDFTILTTGSIISIFGNTLSGFAISLMVLDYSNSVFLFMLYMIINNLPRIAIPLVAGPILDSFSRRKAIYMLDFISAALFLTLFFVMGGGYFNYIFFLAVSLILGTIDGTYLVAYESIYPMLVSEGNYRKAYSVSSIVMPLSAIMFPVATILYENVGINWIFSIFSVAFFIAACVETQIRIKETHLRKSTVKYSLMEFKESFREGINYIRSEKGLLTITAYFLVMTFSGSSQNLLLPYFRNSPDLSVMVYSFVMGGYVAGRIIGGMLQYRIEYPKDKKFLIAMTVYVSVGIIDGGFLFMPVSAMVVLTFISGMLGVTSYNIRISATQSYIPDAKRARFNGAFHMLMNTGVIAGQLISGSLADIVPIRVIIVVFNSISIAAAFLIMLRGRAHVKPIYNRKV